MLDSMGRARSLQNVEHKNLGTVLPFHFINNIKCEKYADNSFDLNKAPI